MGRNEYERAVYRRSFELSCAGNPRGETSTSSHDGYRARHFHGRSHEF